MNVHNPILATLADLIAQVQALAIGATCRRDTVSAIKRIASMMGKSPQSVALDVAGLRDGLAEIHPASPRHQHEDAVEPQMAFHICA